MSGDHYREISGSPEMSPIHEAAVESMVAAIKVEFLRAIDGSGLEDLVWDASGEIGIFEDEKLAVWDEAVAEFRQHLIDRLRGGDS